MFSNQTPLDEKLVPYRNSIRQIKSNSDHCGSRVSIHFNNGWTLVVRLDNIDFVCLVTILDIYGYEVADMVRDEDKSGFKDMNTIIHYVEAVSKLI